MATDDTMENGWGVKYVTYTGKRCGRRTFSAFSGDITKAVPGFELHSVQMCGTDANAVAISLATDYNYSRCHFGIGSYIGGDVCHQTLSSSHYKVNIGLALPKSYDEASAVCQEQTIPLPYHVTCNSVDNKSLLQYEYRCLLHLHQRLLRAELSGAPFKALLMEYMLGGNGGELSLAFLERLGQLLKHFNVVVIADEILTGGRVGPSMTMSTAMPVAFLERISIITMGKLMGCGLVLIPKTKKQTKLDEIPRGFSTQADCGLPSKLFTEVVTRIEAGMIQARRNGVLKLMRCEAPGTEEDHWGRGAQIYTRYSRSSVKQGLRNRCLPRLETSRLIKNGGRKTNWTRSTMCIALMNSADEWIIRQQESLFDDKHAFVTGLISFLFHRVGNGGTNNDDEVLFRPDEVETFLGKKGTIMATSHNMRKRKFEGRKSNANPKSLVKRAIVECIANTQDSRMLYKKRVGNKRTEYTVFDGKTFNVY